MKKSLPVLAAAALLLTACGSPAAESEQPPAPEPVVESATLGPGFDAPAAFGDTVSFPAGFDVTLTAKGSRPVSEEDGVVSKPGDVIVSYEVAVVNNSGERLEADSLSPSIEGDEVYLISNGDLGAVFPGDEAVGVFEQMMPGDAVEDARITVQDPTYMSPAAVFEGSLK